MKSRTVKFIFFAMLFIRVVIAIFMWPGADEAYYFVYTLNPSISYFDHPPMVAFMGGLFYWLFGWVTPLSLRMVPIIFFSVSIYIIYLIARNFVNKEESLMCACIFMLTPMFFISGTLLLPDAGLILFWTLSLNFFIKAVESDRLKYWILSGAFIGLAMLSKYTGAFFYIGGLTYISAVKKYRKLFLRPGPYISIVISLILFSPVIGWNISNNFASFAFQSNRIGMANINFRYFYQHLLGQIGYLLPFVFFPAFYFVVKSIFKISKQDNIYRLIFSFGSIPVILFLFFSLFRRVLPHWSVIGYITVTVLAGAFYYELKKKKPRLFHIYSLSHILIVICAVVITLVQIHTGIIFNRELNENGIAGKKEISDISIDIIGWEKLNKYLKRKYLKKEDIFLFTHKWYLGGQIAFATKGDYPVMCLNNKENSRGFSVWQNQENHLGKTGMFICTSKFFKDPKEKYDSYFSDIKLMHKIPVFRAGKKVKIIYIFRCENFFSEYPV